MNLREQKTDLTQSLLQEFKIDISEPVLDDQPVQPDKKMNNAFSYSTVQLDEIIKKIDRCMGILNELIDGEILYLQSTDNRKFRRYKGNISVLCGILLSCALLLPALLVDDKSVQIIFGALFALKCVIDLFVSYAFIKTYNSRKMQSFDTLLDIIDVNEKEYVFNLSRELDINPYENSLIDLIKLMEKKKSELLYKKTSGPCKAAFMIGGDSFYGAKSSVRTLFKNELFDKKVCGVVFEFAGFSEASKKEKAERATTELKDIMFFTQPFDQEKDEGIIQEILSYMGLNDVSANPENNAVVKLS